jgi:hypothetical protein
MGWPFILGRDTAWTDLVFQVRKPHGLPSFWTDPVSHVEKLGWPYNPRREIGLAQYSRNKTGLLIYSRKKGCAGPLLQVESWAGPEPIGVEFGLAKKPIHLIM